MSSFILNLTPGVWQSCSHANGSTSLYKSIAEVHSSKLVIDAPSFMVRHCCSHADFQICF